MSSELRRDRATILPGTYAVPVRERWQEARARARDEGERWNWPVLSVWVVAIAVSLLIWAGLALLVFRAVT